MRCMWLGVLVFLSMLAVSPRGLADDCEDGIDLEDCSFLKSDEDLILFPSYATWDTERQIWNATAHAWIFEIEPGSIHRYFIRNFLLEPLFDLNDKTDPDEKKRTRLKDRASYLFADSEEDKAVEITVHAQSPFLIGPSKGNGHIRYAFDFAHSPSQEPIWIETTVNHPDEDRDSVYKGQIQLIPGNGVSVISDIDDTIKVSNILADDIEIARIAYTEEYKPVPGMSDLYQTWKDQGAVFHYVSASFWQLYPALSEFMDREGFPRGSFSMKHFQFSNSTILNLKAESYEIKYPLVEKLFKDFPGRSFILVGDSGEWDPEIYADIARKFPAQVQRILIRNVNGADQNSEYYQETFKDIPLKKWALFRDVSEILP